MRQGLRIFRKSTDKTNIMYIKRDKFCLNIPRRYIKGKLWNNKIEEILKAVPEKKTKD